ncbi:MAG: GNAT family N-acetyltransferase [Anaerolineae bacterium]|nr:GNAT family N-acetyltransferase [Anaerolineae bacterium]
MTTVKPTMRMYQTEEDYWRIRPFLREIFLRNDRRQVTWEVARWDYWRWPGVEGWGDGPLEEKVAIWEMPGGRIAAVLNTEGHGEAHLQVHPELRTPDLELAMLEVAEERLAVKSPGGERTLGVWVDSRDQLRHGILERCGYTRDGQAEHQHRLFLEEPIPDVPVAEGFTIRSLGDIDELPARSWFSWKAFNPDAPEEDYAALGWEWYLEIQHCPLYRRDLDLVIVAPNGDLASFTTVWFDDVTRSAYFEPVGTYLLYHRRGLARAVMTEGLRRAQHLGATVAFVGGYSVAANALYDAVMGPEYARSERWSKVMP